MTPQPHPRNPDEHSGTHSSPGAVRLMLGMLFLVLPVFFLPYHRFYHFQLGKELLVLLLTSLAFSSWILHGLRSGEIRWRIHPLHPYLGAYLIWIALGLGYAPGFSPAFHRIALIAAAAALYWLLFNSRGLSGEFRLPVALLAAGAGIASLVGILQHADLLWQRFPDHYDELMTTSTFDHANHAAQMLVFSLPLTGSLLVSSSGSRRMLPALSFLLQIIFLVLTQSRAAWLAVLIVFTFGTVLLLRPLGRKAIPALLLIGILGSGLVLAGSRVPPLSRALSHLGTIFDPGYGPNRARLLVWNDTLKLIRSHPLRGSGPASFPMTFPEVQSDRLARLIAELDQMVESPHNEYLRTIAESGIIGFILLAAGGIALMIPFLPVRIRTSPPPRRTAFPLGFVLALMALLIHMLFDHPLTKPVPLMGFGLLLAGCAHFSSAASRTRRIPIPGKPLRTLLVVITICFIGATLFLLSRWVASDYYRDQARALFPHSPEESLEAIDISIRLEPRNYLSHFLKGGYLASLGESRPDRALLTLSVSEYQNTLALFPAFYPALLNQGTVLLKLGLPLEARAAFERVRAFQPYHPRANFYLGTILAGLGRTDEARELFDLAVKIRPATRKDIEGDPRLRALFPEFSGLQSETEQHR